jgi:hypothetical protein
MVRRHRRFELLEVSFADVPIGRCTMDHWEDDHGQEQWTARVLMDRAHGSTAGILVGRTREGRTLSGPAEFAADQEGPRGARTVLAELRGVGPLVEVAEPSTQQESPTG